MKLLKVHQKYIPSVLGVSYDASASAYYRLAVPLRTLHAIYKAHTSWVSAQDDRIFAAQYYDLVVLSRVSTRQIDQARRTISLLHQHGTRVLLDYDDDFLSIPEWNPFRLSIEAQDSIRDLMGIADGVLVTNQALAQRYTPYAKRVQVLPNFIESDSWPDTRKPNDKLRIGLYGSASHHEDWRQVAEPLRRIMDRYADQVELCVSDPVPEYLQGIPMTVQPWIQLSRYPMLLNQVDIGLCPLQDDTFNRGKSPVKALEYGLAGAAVVASPTQYREIVAGRGTVARTDEEWYAGIEKYILSPDRRKLAGRLLQQFVRDRWDAKRRAEVILRVYQEMYRNATDAQGSTVAALTI
jgi:glycosyltransferase involved in cell wall biosynthesis